jgi:Fe-S-cluster containining protein
MSENRNNSKKTNPFPCRKRCGACCIAPSISAAIPGMPHGKPAGVPCIHLDDEFRCRIFHSPERPAVCGSLQPSKEMCGNCREEALAWLAELERLTAPDPDQNR